MRAIVVLSAVVVATSLALWPSLSYAAQKGRAASAPSGKSTVSPGAVAKKANAPKIKKLKDRARGIEKDVMRAQCPGPACIW